VLDANAIYFATLGQDNQQTDGSLQTVPKNGGAASALLDPVLGPQAIAIDAANLYWSGAGSAIHRLPLVGGSPSIVLQAESLPRELAVDATHLYWRDMLMLFRAPK
jgi:hypothetical protein